MFLAGVPCPLEADAFDRRAGTGSNDSSVQCRLMPRQIGRPVLVVCGAKARDFEKGVLVERDPAGWDLTTDDDGGEGNTGVVQQVNMMQGEGYDLSILWLKTGLRRMVVQRKVRLADLGGWRCDVQLRLSHERAGNAIGPEGARVLGAVLALNVPIRRVGLDYNHVGKRGAQDILNGLRRNPHTVEIDMQGGDAPMHERAAIALRCRYHALGPKEALTIDTLIDQELGAEWVSVAADALWDVDSLRLPFEHLCTCPREARRLANLMCQYIDKNAAMQQTFAPPRPPRPPVGMLLLRTVGGSGCGSSAEPISPRQPGFDPIPRSPKSTMARPPSVLLGPSVGHRASFDTRVNSFSISPRSVGGNRLCAELTRLVRRGSDPDERDSEGRTPLHFATQYGGEAVADTLLDLGAMPSVLCNRGHVAALHAARNPAFRGDDGEPGATLRRLATPEALHASGTSGRDALNLAVFEGTGDPVAVRALIALGADVARATSEGWVPLHVAMKQHFGACLDAVALLATAATINARDAKGRTPLHYAAMIAGRCPGLTELLLKLGSEASPRENTFGNTPLHCAAYLGQAAAAKALLAAGADGTAVNNGGDTPQTLARSRARAAAAADRAAYLATVTELGNSGSRLSPRAPAG